MSAADAGLERQEIEADVLEIWIVASRLLGRLAEYSRPLARRRGRTRRGAGHAIKPTGAQPASIP